VPAADREPELVEEGPHVVRVVTMEVDQLDTLVADLANAAQRPFEVAPAVAAQRVQHQAHT
jgi:hypothetical protein